MIGGEVAQPRPQTTLWGGGSAVTWYDARMTKLFEQAIAKVRELPEEDQDTLAFALLSMASDGAATAPLDDASRSAIREGLEQARRGEFVPDEEIAAIWSRHGL